MVFVAVGLAIAYVLVVYPCILNWLAHRFPQPIAKNDQHRDTVTVIIAVRNGERWLARKIESVLAQDYPEGLRDILIVSDGSTDSTDRIAESYSNCRVHLLRVPQGGKPAALNAAVPHATGNLLFLTDVRQILNSDCLRRLVAVMADPAVGVVSGDLRIAPGENAEQHNTGMYWR